MRAVSTIMIAVEMLRGSAPIEMDPLFICDESCVEILILSSRLVPVSHIPVYVVLEPNSPFTGWSRGMTKSSISS